MIGGMAMHGPSPTATASEYQEVICRCRKCSELKWDCLCWMWSMTKIEWILYKIYKLDIYKHVVMGSKWIPVINLVRKTLNHISGMKGLKLLEKIDKRGNHVSK